MEKQTFKKIITEKEFSQLVSWSKEQPIPYKYFETIFNSLLQLPDLNTSEKKEEK